MNNFWNDRYLAGISSGKGSVGAYRDWKWAIIEQYIGSIDNVVDVGCGDLSFWDGRGCTNYQGIDISKHIISLNKHLKPAWQFFVHGADKYNHNVKGDIVLCLDLLFHILNDNIFRDILTNVCYYSREWIFIFTWQINIFYMWKVRKSFFLTRKWGMLFRSLIHRLDSDNLYQKYRDFSEFFDFFINRGFNLEAIEVPEFDKTSAMYIFRSNKEG